MPVCSYLVLPAHGEADVVASRLAALPGCDVVRASNSDVLILVTDTGTADEELALREEIAASSGIQAMVLTFGEVEPGGEGGAAGEPPAAAARDEGEI